jgi:Uma2 family endonuclease
VAEFHRLCDQLPERRFELIDGEVLEVIAKGSRHTAVVHRLARALTPLLASPQDGESLLCGHELRIEAPLDLGEHQEPEPDLAVVTARSDAWLEAHPTAADSLLVIEVADAGDQVSMFDYYHASLMSIVRRSHSWPVIALSTTSR